MIYFGEKMEINFSIALWITRFSLNKILIIFIFILRIINVLLIHFLRIMDFIARNNIIDKIIAYSLHKNIFFRFLTYKNKLSDQLKIQIQNTSVLTLLFNGANTFYFCTNCRA